MNALELERAQYLKRLMSDLDRSGRGQKGVIVQAAMDHLCISKSKLYQALTDLGWTSGRKTRADNGDLALTKEEPELLSNMIRQSKRESGKALMTVRDAVDIALAKRQHTINYK